ncbi:hypothetical protein [Sulfurimonas sp.]|uniref:hypothetical protein n=1 Tax=Sulfurimonas sp. TaxID=2022749 RepID=UPI003D13B5B6
MSDINKDLPLDESAQTLIKSLIDKNKDLVFVFYKNQLVLFNQAAQKFFHVDDIAHFTREFARLEDRFVPHNFYFHAEKISDNQTWQQAIMELEESKRIVSIFNHNFKPHAFSVIVDTLQDQYEVIFFHDITTDLIKSLMIENNTNLDESSGAYNRNYFENISSGYVDAASFNDKLIALCIINVNSKDKDTIYSVAQDIKRQIRDDDMLTRWSDTSFLLTCLIWSEDHALAVTKKILESSKTNKVFSLQIITTIKQSNESMNSAIKRCEKKLQETSQEYLII